MAFGRHTSGFNTEVGRYGRAITMFGSGLLALALGSVASAAPVLSFDSVTAVADGTTATNVTIEVKVTNPDPTFGVTALTSQMNWVASGSATASDLISVGTGTANTPGYLFASTFDSLTIEPGTIAVGDPIDWGVATTGLGSTMAGSGTSTVVARINMQIAAGITSGVFNVTFLTGDSDFNAFSNNSFNPVLYTNGNNGTTTGVITVVPEPVATGYVATAGVVAAGLGFVQRRSRRSRRLAEVAG